MNFVLCDDDPAFLELFRQRLLDECARKDWNCGITLFTSERALLLADLSTAQVIFLDIDMPEMNGLEAAQRLRAKYAEVLLVFVTGFYQYAASGYKVRAFRYLLKSELASQLSNCLDDIWKQLFIRHESILVNSVDGPARVRLEDIIYIKGTGERHVLLHLENTAPKVLECIGSLDQYQAKLAGKTFLRIHKCHIANMYHISAIKSYKALMDNREVLSVSRRRYSEICSQYILWRGQA